MRQIFLDTETTGLSPLQGHRVIEIGCLEMINRRLTGNSFHCYLNPMRLIDPEATKIHGITDSFLKDKPVFEKIVDELMAFIRDAELVIHNAPFDIGFLNYEMQLINKDFSSITDYCSVLDTLMMARHKHPGQQNSLDALCRRYQVDLSQREYHGALLDAQLLAQVYLAMTGGQTGFFDVTDHSEKLQQATIKRVSEDRAPLPVIYANEQELKSHQEFLEWIKTDL